MKIKRQRDSFSFELFWGSCGDNFQPKMGFYNCSCFREQGYKRTQARLEMHSFEKLSHTQDWERKSFLKRYHGRYGCVHVT